MDIKFSVSYAPTGRATCKFCRERIPKDTVRISKTIPMPWMTCRGDREAHFHLKCGVDAVANVVANTAKNRGHMRLVGVETLADKDIRQLDRLYAPVAPALFRTHRVHCDRPPGDHASLTRSPHTAHRL
jgi:hypothetical protein